MHIYSFQVHVQARRGLLPLCGNTIILSKLKPSMRLTSYLYHCHVYGI